MSDFLNQPAHRSPAGFTEHTRFRRGDSSTTELNDDCHLIINLGYFEGNYHLTTSVWQHEGYFSSDPDRGGNQHTLTESDDGRTLTIVPDADADPASTRFRLDGVIDGLQQNLVLGYLDLHSDDLS